MPRGGIPTARFLAFLVVSFLTCLTYDVFLLDLVDKFLRQTFSEYGCNHERAIVSWGVPALSVLGLSWVFGAWRKHIDWTFKVVIVMSMFVIPYFAVIVAFASVCAVYRDCL